jgi:thiamine kinase-like enzyme
MNTDALLDLLGSAGLLDVASTRSIGALLHMLRPSVSDCQRRCFLHNDIHGMNVLCSPQGSLLSIIDWGDAGWGDPATEFTWMPLEAVPPTLAGYMQIAPELPGKDVRRRIAWDRLHAALETKTERPDETVPIPDLRTFVQTP